MNVSLSSLALSSFSSSPFLSPTHAHTLRMSSLSALFCFSSVLRISGFTQLAVLQESHFRKILRPVVAIVSSYNVVQPGTEFYCLSCQFQGPGGFDEDNGSFVLCNSSGTTVSIYGCTIAGQNALNGGALYLICKAVYNYYNCFTDCTAGNVGGVGYFKCEDLDEKFESFLRSSGDSTVSIAARNIEVANCNFTSSETKTGFGCILCTLYESDSSFIKFTAFTNNSCTSSAVVAYVSGNETSFFATVVSHCMFQQHADIVGSLVSVGASNTAYMTRCYFLKNGNSIMCTGPTMSYITMENCVYDAPLKAGNQLLLQTLDCVEFEEGWATPDYNLLNYMACAAPVVSYSF